jgi:hypothetical protein
MQREGPEVKQIIRRIKVAENELTFPRGNVPPKVDDPELVVEPEVPVGDSHIHGDLSLIANFCVIKLPVVGPDARNRQQNQRGEQYCFQMMHFVLLVSLRTVVK